MACLHLLGELFDFLLDDGIRQPAAPCATSAPKQDLLVDVHVAQELGGGVEVVDSDLMPLLGESISQVRATVVQRGKFLVLCWWLIVAEIPSIGEAEVTNTIGLRY